MTLLYRNKEKAYKKPNSSPSKKYGWWVGAGGSQSRKVNFALIYRKLRDLDAKVGDRKDFFRDYNRLLAKQEVIFILDDLNRAFYINSNTGEVIKGEVTGVLRFRFHLGEDDHFDLDFTGGDV